MSEQDNPVPPVPEHTPPLKEDALHPDQGRFFNHSWTRWFISLREKVNVINSVVAELSKLSGSGVVEVDGGVATTIGTTDLVAGSNVVFTGTGTKRILDNGDGPLTINSLGGSGGGYLPLMTTILLPNCTATDNGFTLVRSGGSDSSRVYYHSVGKSTGKYALRFLITAPGATSAGPAVGILGNTLGTFLGNSSLGISFWANSGGSNIDRTISNNVTTTRGNLADFTTPTEVMLEVDFDAGAIWIGVAGTFINSGDPVAGTNATYTFTPNINFCPAIDMYYQGTVTFLTPPDFITPASTGYTPGWPS